MHVCESIFRYEATCYVSRAVKADMQCLQFEEIRRIWEIRRKRNEIGRDRKLIWTRSVLRIHIYFQQKWKGKESFRYIGKMDMIYAQKLFYKVFVIDI